MITSHGLENRGHRRLRKRSASARAPAFAAAVLYLLQVTVIAAPTSAREDSARDLSAQELVERAHAAAGGGPWREVETLQLSGSAVFYRNGLESAAVADDYRMWRVLPRASTDAHRANGMVRFDARAGGKTLFQISFDGEDSYDQHGRIDDRAASEQWKSNFGFGIIRFALNPDFKLKRMADDTIDGHDCYLILVTDPSDRETLFAIDRDSHNIRMVGFDTPRGFHHRIYGDFQRKADISFTQPGHVRLYYEGVKTADIRWTDFTINEPLRRSQFVLATSKGDQP